MLGNKGAQYRVYSGLCPDLGCQTKLVFPFYESSIECTNCGQRHEQKSLKELQEVTDPNVALHNMLRNVLLGKTVPKKGAEMVKVLGLSNYHCKLLSHLLTRYGMDKKSGRARSLKELNQGDIFDCSILGDRCFMIDSEHIDVVGYGRDISGSTSYLADTLAAIRFHNEDDERLVPIHADGDGHCLVHAISRALVGRELFWHPLRTSLKQHFLTSLERYKTQFHDFIDASEWRVIVEECSPDFEPPDGELLGLRNIHIFGLANVLKRPIILLDSLSGMQSSGDYAATFLPAMVDPRNCRGKNGELNKPLCIAWSSNGRNHYIPLVGMKKCPLPRLPQMLVPKAWGVPNHLLDEYIEFDVDGYCIIGGDKCLQDNYILRLAWAMEEVFLKKYSVHPALVADVHHYIYKRTGVVGAKLGEVLEATEKATREKRLYICLMCSAICEQRLVAEWFRKGGALYSLAEQRHGQLQKDKLYSFPLQGVICSYDAEGDKLVPTGKETYIEKCSCCQGTQIRLVNGDGSIQYNNGDRTKTRAQSSQCNCGFKHFWEGKEYDNQPQIIPVVLEWAGKTITEKVAWFQYESDPALNSNVYEVTNSLVQKHFPGVFGSERLVKKVVDQILEQTKQPEEQAAPRLDSNIADSEGTRSPPSSSSPRKIILSGYHVVHKEELTKSNVERTVHHNIVENAALRQRRRSAERQLANEKPSKTSPATASSTRQKSDSVIGTSPQRTTSPPPTAGAKMVRIVTSDGRQSMLTELTSAAFLDKLANEMGLDRSCVRKILYGFPPKSLPLSLLDDVGATLPFHPGDKVSLEVATAGRCESGSASEGPLDLVDSTSGHQHGKDPASILQRLQNMHNSNVDNLDASITSLLLAASLTHPNPWSYIQGLPNLFEAGGLLYLQMKRDVGLTDGKHCRVSILPDKVFRYSAEHDRLELCLEPHGHFAVEEGIEERVLRHEATTAGPFARASSTGTVHGVGDLLMTGSSGIYVNPQPKQSDGSRIPFCGQGYTLKSPSIVSPAVHTTTSLDYYLDGGSIRSNAEPDRAESCDEQMDTDSSSRDNKTLVERSEASSTSSSVPAMLRKGPGFSVLNPEVTNFCNSHLERMRFLASQLDRGNGSNHDRSDAEPVQADSCDEQMDTNSSRENKTLVEGSEEASSTSSVPAMLREGPGNLYPDLEGRRLLATQLDQGNGSNHDREELNSAAEKND